MSVTRAASTEQSSRQPLVSILVPCYNGATYLRESLDSILAQTYANIEVILLDDASTDETPRIAEEYAGRIAYVRQAVNLGQFGNVNDGIRRASGELVAVWHADDVYLPSIAEHEVAYLVAHPDVAAVFTTDLFIDADGYEYGRMVLPAEIRGERPLEYRIVLNSLLTYRNRFLVGPSAMVRAAVYREVGEYCEPRYGIASDLEMWMRISRRHAIAVLEAPGMKYRHFHGNASQHYQRLRTDPDIYFAVVDEYLDAGGRAVATPAALRSHEAHRSEDRLMAAISHYIKGEPHQGRRALRAMRLGAILRTPQVQRTRLLVLAAGLHLLLRLPRVPSLADAMFRRWHVKRPPSRRASAVAAVGPKVAAASSHAD